MQNEKYAKLKIQFIWKNKCLNSKVKNMFLLLLEIQNKYNSGRGLFLKLIFVEDFHTLYFIHNLQLKSHIHVRRPILNCRPQR